MGIDSREFLGNVCPHLKPLVEAMLAGGAEVIGVTRFIGAAYALNLTAGLKRDFAIAQARERRLEFSESNDPHYAIEYFLICTACSQGVAWPQSAAVVDTLGRLADLSIN